MISHTTIESFIWYIGSVTRSFLFLIFIYQSTENKRSFVNTKKIINKNEKKNVLRIE